MKKLLLSIISVLCLGFSVQAQDATLRIDGQTKYQHITGFGGFVCSPQFGYNHIGEYGKAICSSNAIETLSRL